MTTTNKKKEQVKIFDTTLRDGQQCPGAGMSFKNNIRYFELAAKAVIDVVEAGFPSASAIDFEIVHTIAKDHGRSPDCPIIAGLCQLREEQVDKTIEALLPAAPNKRARLHVYLPVDPNLMAASLGSRATDKSGLVRDVYAFVKKACAAGMEVEFSPEGYSRMGENMPFVTDAIIAAIEGGATIINCPDTIGGAYRFEGETYFVSRMNKHAAIAAERFPSKRITWSAHCHNDFGMALDNSLNAVVEGPARQIEGCINGVGERAGNVSLEQCIMAIKHFGPVMHPEVEFFTTVRTEHLKPLSDFVHEHMLPRQPHSPIVGDNAAKHSSGGHTNAILKNPMAYQPFDPKEVGTEVSFIFGPLSGGNHAKSIIEARGFVCRDEEKAAVAQFIKDLYSDRRKGITDKELMDGYFEFRKPIVPSAIDYAKSTNRSTVLLAGRFFGETANINENHEGKDSALAALKTAIDKRFPGLHVESHRSSSKGTGIEAVSLSTIVLADDAGNTYAGDGEDRDIEISAMKALIDAVNNAYIVRHFKIEGAQPQKSV